MMMWRIIARLHIMKMWRIIARLLPLPIMPAAHSHSCPEIVQSGALSSHWA